MNKRMESWETGDFGRHLRGRAETSKDGVFKERFGKLARALAPRGREFCPQTAA